MLTKVLCAALHGVDARVVDLEVDFARQGMPLFTMVGLPDSAVREAKERVLSALKNAGKRLPPAKVTVNLAPADLRKEGAGYDLPLALALIAAAGETFAEGENPLEGYFIVGELSLSGDVKPVRGALPLAVLAKELGAKGVVAPFENAPEAAVVEGLPVYPVRSLAEATAFFSGETPIAPLAADLSAFAQRAARCALDYADVKGQDFAKRAVEIAAAGAHNCLFMGPPGSGKTMLARRLPSVLPPLSFAEALEVTKIYSVAGQLDPAEPLVFERPFRAPHHTVSDAGLIGGGRIPRPGEVTLAHRGVLFLDELPEFDKHVLEVLRQPLEDGEVTISRAQIALTYPADFMLVAAMNPCPCGHLTDPRHACVCSHRAVSAYRSRLSGPLLDRIDLHVEVPAVEYKDLQARATGLDSATMRGRIERAREIQRDRFGGEPPFTNSGLTGRMLDKHCALGPAEHGFLQKAVDKLGLSARAYTRILRIARTIADLDGAGGLVVDHLAEAVSYRGLDRRSH